MTTEPSREESDSAAQPPPPAGNEHPDSGNRTDHRRILARLTWILLFFATLLVGVFLGTAADWTQLAVFSWETAAALFAGALFAMVVVAAAAYVSFKLWSSSLLDKARSTLDGLLKDVTQLRRPEYWGAALRPRLMDFARVAAAYMAFAGAVGLILGLITNLTLVATLVVSRAQADRLAEQNSLLKTNNELTVLDRVSQMEQDTAQRKYDEINRILSESESIAEQRYAVRMIPDVMVLPVHRAVDDNGKNKVDDYTLSREVIYPNLQPLKDRLIAFLREDRIGQMLRRERLLPIGRSRAQVDPANLDGVMRLLEPLSDEILDTLHRLGEANGEVDANQCVWRWNPRMATKPNIAAPIHWSNDVRKGVLDLRHLDNRELEGCQLPYALFVSGIRADNQERELLPARLPKQAKFRTSRLYGATFSGVQLRHADFERADLQGANFEGAALQGASFTGAVLPGAVFRGAELQGARFGGAMLQGADFDGVVFPGAHFSHAELQGAHFSGADLQGARFIRAVLPNADLSQAKLQGANLNSAVLLGANLYEA